MTATLIEKVEQRKFTDLFLLDLYWNAPNHAPLQVDLGGGVTATATNVASYQGVRVWEVPCLPGSAGEAQIDRAISATSTNRLVIFHDEDKQVWRWPSRSTRGAGVISRPARHVHRVGSPDPRFAEKLDAIRLPSDASIDVNELLMRVRGAFDVETKNETKRASKLMAQMYAAVEKGYDDAVAEGVRDHEISVTLARVLFLLFGDDTEMWKSPSGEPLPDLFQDFIKDQTDQGGGDIASRLNQLFKTLNMDPSDRGGVAAELAMFPYVNGGIFEEPITLPDLDADFREAILAASAVDWSTISPAIFGSMFQSVRDAQTRRELGEHYTSEENILKTLNPLFLDELRSEFEHILTLKIGRTQKLYDLWTRLGDVRYMDPACGCGNFIIVAYRELRDLELRIMDALATLTDGEDAMALDTDWTHLLKVTLDHFYGIEIDEWPARIAETAMFLIDRQCDLKMKERFGAAPERLPIQTQATIVVGNALRTDWKSILPASPNVVIAGNPPFLGHGSRTDEQSREIRDLWGRDDIGRLDYATGWYAKCLDYFGKVPGRWAFVSTNSLVQGEPVATLFSAVFGAGWRIRFAHRTFAWESEAVGAAAVHCVIVGFDRGGKSPALFVYVDGKGVPDLLPAKFINAYLVDGPNVLVEQRRKMLSPALKPFSFGSRPNDGGAFVVEPDQVEEFRADPIASKYLRRFVGARELLHAEDRWCLWLEDALPSDLSASALLGERVESCRQHRLASRRAATREWAQWPHRFDFNSQPTSEYLCAPGVTSERRWFMPAARFGPEVVTSNAAFTSPDPDGFQFAVISSSMFIAWQRAIGGRLESRLRFSNTVVWSNVPLREVAPETRTSVCAAGEAVLAARELEPEKSLAQHYDPETMSSALLDAHRALDELVDRMFGAKRTCSFEEERQEILFQRYAEMTGTADVTVAGMLAAASQDELF